MRVMVSSCSPCQGLHCTASAIAGGGGGHEWVEANRTSRALRMYNLNLCMIFWAAFSIGDKPCTSRYHVFMCVELTLGWVSD